MLGQVKKAAWAVMLDWYPVFLDASLNRNKQCRKERWTTANM
jgi:hypothetical protein